MSRANKFTAARLLCAPLVFLVYQLPVWTGKFGALSVYILVPLVIFAELTDFFDGRAARKDGDVSGFGKLFDPFADVTLNITAFLALTLSGYMPGVFLLLIVYREFSMTFLRAVAAAQGLTIAARKGGKTKTFFYAMAISYAMALECLLRLGVYQAVPGICKMIGIVLLGICVFLSYSSFIDYLIHFKDTLWKGSH